MMKGLLVIFLLLVSIPAAQADTLSYWSVHYNDSLVRYGLAGTSGPVLELHPTQIEALDLLSIRFISDLPCSNCPATVEIEDDQHVRVASDTTHNAFNPFRISAHKLLRYNNRPGRDQILDMFYRKDTSRSERTLLFRIRLE